MGKFILIYYSTLTRNPNLIAAVVSLGCVNSRALPLLVAPVSIELYPSDLAFDRGGGNALDKEALEE